VGEGPGVGDVVEGNDLYILAGEEGYEREAADATESVDGYACHGSAVDFLERQK
jgi:hypothetical protein